MAVLRFQARWIEPVIDGRKVQTLRGKLPGGIQVGRIVDAGSSYSQPPWGRLTIDGVDEVDLDELTEQDAQADGFGSLEELRAELARLYPGLRRLWRIRFTCVDWAAALEPAHMRLAGV